MVVGTKTHILPLLGCIVVGSLFYVYQTRARPIPKIIWCYWEGKRPALIETILQRNSKTLQDWEIRCLSDTTLSTYLSIEDVKDAFTNASPQHKADYIRLALLQKYGGVWMDLSTIVYDGAALNAMRHSAMVQRASLVAFTLGDPGVEYIENWFIMAPRHSPIIYKWYVEYTKAMNMGFHQYKTNVFAAGYTISPRIYKADDDNVYFTQHAGLQVVRQRPDYQKHTVMLYKAEDSMFKIHDECKWDVSCIQKQIKTLDNDTRVPFIKLRSDDRVNLAL